MDILCPNHTPEVIHSMRGRCLDSNRNIITIIRNYKSTKTWPMKQQKHSHIIFIVTTPSIFATALQRSRAQSDTKWVWVILGGPVVGHCPSKTEGLGLSLKVPFVPDLFHLSTHCFKSPRMCFTTKNIFVTFWISGYKIKVSCTCSASWLLLCMIFFHLDSCLFSLLLHQRLAVVCCLLEGMLS